MAQPHLNALWSWFTTTALPAVLNFITGTVIPGIGNFINFLKRLWTDVQPFLQFLFDWFMTTALPLVTNFITTSVLPTLENFIGLLGDIWTRVQPFLQQLYDWFITSGLPAIQHFIETVITPAFEVFIGLLAGLWELTSAGITAFRDNIDAIFGWIKTHVIDPIIARVEDFLELLGRVKGEAENALSSARNDIDNLRNALQEGGVSGAFQQGASNIGSFLSNVGAALFADSGPRGQPGQAYVIGTGAQPEVFMPDTPGQFHPNADFGSRVYNLNIASINAASAAEGRAAGYAFADAFMERVRAEP
jgi:hypothetical protein